MSLRFVKTASAEPVVADVAATLEQHLRAGESVLWLISGGSVIKVAVAIAQALLEADAPLKTLTVSLTDERPGPVGHTDSNWQQLQGTGFNLPGARLQPVLTGADPAHDTASFAYFLDGELGRNQFCLGLFGIGPDGHTAGLPAEGASEQPGPAAYYEAGSFHRISMTPASLHRLDDAVAYVMGENKHGQIDRLATKLPYAEQSAQALKLAPNLTVYNDHKGDSA